MCDSVLNRRRYVIKYMSLFCVFLFVVCVVVCVNVWTSMINSSDCVIPLSMFNVGPECQHDACVPYYL